MSTLFLSDFIGDFEQPNLSTKLANIEMMSSAGLKMFPACGIINGGGTCGRNGETLNLAGKHPALGASPADATSDVKLLTRYFNSNPFDNVAVHCGSSNLVVIDIDPRSGGYESWKKFCESNAITIPPTVQVSTGNGVEGTESRGTHLYFRCPSGLSFVGNLAKFGYSGVDIKHNGYVIAPSSMHRTGVTYEFKPGSSPSDLPIAEMPDDLLEFLSKKASPSSIGSVVYPEGALAFLKNLEATTSNYGRSALEGEISKISSAREGERNVVLFSSACRLASLAAGGEVNFQEMFSRIYSAAAEIGLPLDEVENTLTRTDGAFERGASKPSSASHIGSELATWAISSNSSWAENDEPVDPKAEFLKRANVLDLHAIFSNPTEEEWLVPGFICARRGHSLISAAGLGKSLLMREIAAKLALGEAIVPGGVQSPKKVLYIDHENDPLYDIGRSLKDMGLDAPDALAENLVFLSYPEFGPFDTADGGKDLEEALDIFSPDLVIIDTLSRVVTGEENSNDTWLRFYRHAGQLIKKRGIAYVRIDHLGKNSESGARGGSAKSGDVDLIWTLEGVSGAESKFKLVNSKSRAPLKDKVIYVERGFSPLRHEFIEPLTAQFKFKELIAKAKSHSSIIEKLILDKAAGTLMGQKATWEALKERCESIGLSKSKLEAMHRIIRMSDLDGEELLHVVWGSQMGPSDSQPF